MTPTKTCFAVTMFACSVFTLGCGDDGSGDGGSTPDADTTRADAMVDNPDATPGTSPVTGLTSGYTGPCDQVDLAWSNPSGASYAGAIVIRMVGGAVSDVPTNGTSYSAGDVLPGGGVVAFVGDAAAFQDTAGFYHGDDVHYAVLTFTAGNDYSAAAATNIRVDQSLGAQTGKISISLTDNVVTVTSPGNFTVTGTADFNSAANTLSLDLDMTNGACRAVHNAKLVATTINEVAAVPTGDITFAAQEALYFGPTALADAAAGSSQFNFTNVSGTVDPFEIDFSVIDHASLLLDGNYDEAVRVLDSSGVGNATIVDAKPLEFGGSSGDSMVFQGAVSRDGELLYLGHGQQPMIVTVDLATNTAVGSTDLTGLDNIQNDTTGSIGHVPSLTMSPDAKYLYAVLVTNDHRAYFCTTTLDPEGNCDVGDRIDPAAASSDVVLVRLDRETMVEVDRITLLSASALRPRASVMSMSADGSRGAIALRREGKVFLVDLDNMTIVDGDSQTAGVQPFDTSASSTEPRFAALAPDASEIIVAYRGDGSGGPVHDETLDRINVSTGAVTTLAVTTSSGTTNNKVGALTFGPDGRLYYVRKNGTLGLSIFDLNANTEVELESDSLVNSIVFAPDGASYYIWKEGAATLTHYSIADDTTIPTADDGDDPRDFDAGFGHSALITPL